MRHELAELISVLEGLLDTSRSLLDATKHKCKALAAMKLDLITQATEQEEGLVARINQLTDRRRMLLAALTGETPRKGTSDAAHDGTLGRLIEGLDEPERGRIAVLRQQLCDVMKDIQFSNVTNSIVSRRSLRHFRELLGLLSGSGPPDDRYDHRGKVAAGRGPVGLLNHVV